VKAAIVISERDNVATALEPLERGRALDLAGHHVVTGEAIPSGHKVAIVDIREGSAVVKYGSSIGTAARAIPAGMHVHTHNVSSDRGRGDRVVAQPEAGVRLAEPPDERNGRGAAEGGGRD
jgi:altronate dehydratase